MPSGIKGKIPAPCHPERTHYGKGLCRQCYNALWRREHPDQMREYQIRQQPRRTILQREYRRQDPDRYVSAVLKNLYGISLEKRQALEMQQGGVCAICGDPPRNKSLHVDHDHGTGKVRGLLCTKCNPGLGFFDHDIEKLEAAIEYLKSTE